MPLRLLADAGAQTTIALPLGSGATSFVGGSTANFPVPQNFGNGVTRLTILDSGNPAWNPAVPLATPYEYCSYTSNVIGTNMISGLTRGEAGTTAKNFLAGATVAVGWLAEDILASVPWKFDEQSPSGVATVRIPASGSIPGSYLGVNWRHLSIRVLARGDVAANNVNLYIQFNGDTTANYLWDQLYGNNNAAVSTQGVAATGQPQIGLVTGASGAAGMCADITIDIANFAGTTFNKIAKSSSVSFETNAAANEWIIFRGASWSNTAAITSITLGLLSGNFLAGSLITTELRP